MGGCCCWGVRGGSKPSGPQAVFLSTKHAHLTSHLLLATLPDADEEELPPPSKGAKGGAKGGKAKAAPAPEPVDPAKKVLT